MRLRTAKDSAENTQLSVAPPLTDRYAPRLLVLRLKEDLLEASDSTNWQEFMSGSQYFLPRLKANKAEKGRQRAATKGGGLSGRDESGGGGINTEHENVDEAATTSELSDRLEGLPSPPLPFPPPMAAAPAVAVATAAEALGASPTDATLATAPAAADPALEEVVKAPPRGASFAAKFAARRESKTPRMTVPPAITETKAPAVAELSTSSPQAVGAQPFLASPLFSPPPLSASKSFGGPTPPPSPPHSLPGSSPPLSRSPSPLPSRPPTPPPSPPEAGEPLDKVDKHKGRGLFGGAAHKAFKVMTGAKKSSTDLTDSSGGDSGGCGVADVSALAAASAKGSGSAKLGSGKHLDAEGSTPKPVLSKQPTTPGLVDMGIANKQKRSSVLMTKQLSTLKVESPALAGGAVVSAELGGEGVAAPSPIKVVEPVVAESPKVGHALEYP